MNSKDDLKGLLMRALHSPHGIITAVDGQEANQRQSALTALLAAKRELLAEEPGMLDLQIKPVPGTKDQIAIRHITHIPE